MVAAVTRERKQMLFILIGSLLFQYSSLCFLVWLLAAASPPSSDSGSLSPPSRGGLGTSTGWLIRAKGLYLKYQKCRMMKGSWAVLFVLIRIQKQGWEIMAYSLQWLSQNFAAVVSLCKVWPTMLSEVYFPLVHKQANKIFLLKFLQHCIIFYCMDVVCLLDPIDCFLLRIIQLKTYKMVIRLLKLCYVNFNSD